MRTCWPIGSVCLVVGLTGCVSDGHGSLAFRNPFETDRGPDPNKLPPASTLAATRVNSVGSAIMAKNSDALGIKPVFFTMGVKEVEISHNKSGMVILSEGLVDRCPTDTELAAAICHELGKLAADRTPNRSSDAEPSGRPLSRDVVGGTYEPDMTRLAEEAKFDRRGSRGDRSARDARPDSRSMAANFFVQAGYKADDFAHVDQLMHEAEDNADRRASERGR
jgi:hypothetical protein